MYGSGLLNYSQHHIGLDDVNLDSDEGLGEGMPPMDAATKCSLT